MARNSLLCADVPLRNYSLTIPVAQVTTRRHLRSAARHQLTVPRHRLSTYGRRAFAGPMTFNTLPNDLRDPSVSTATFGQLLKTHLFSAYKHVSALGVSHVMRYIKSSIYITYLLTYLVTSEIWFPSIRLFVNQSFDLRRHIDQPIPTLSGKQIH